MNVSIEMTAKRLSEMLEGCFRRTEASSLHMTKQRYDSIHEEIKAKFCDFVKDRLSSDETLTSKKSEFSIAEVIVKVMCENINSGELDTCYNIWQTFRDEDLYCYDNHFTQLRDLETNIRRDMLVYFWNKFASSNCLGHNYNTWWVIYALEDDGYLVFKDVFPHDLKAKMSSFSMKHSGQSIKISKSTKHIEEESTNNKGERIMKEYGNKGAFGTPIPSPNSFGYDRNPDWMMSPLKDGKLRLTKVLPSGGSKSFIVSVDDDGSTLNIENHDFKKVVSVYKSLKEEGIKLSEREQNALLHQVLGNYDEQGSVFPERNLKVHSGPSTHIFLKDMSNPFHFKGSISHEDELRMEGNIVGDLYSLEPIDPESKKFFHYEEGKTVISVVWTGITWALYDGLMTPEKFKGFVDNVNSLQYEVGVKEDTILAFNTISKKYERYEHDGSGWVQWGLTSGSMKYSALAATIVSDHFQLPDGRFMKKDTSYFINSNTPLYQTNPVCLVNQRENGWINQEVISRMMLTPNKLFRPVYAGVLYGADAINPLEEFNQKYCRITGDTISVKLKQKMWMDFVWDGEHWYEIPTDVPNVQFKGVIDGMLVIPENEARRGDVYFCIKEKQCYIFRDGAWEPYFK